MGHTTTATVTIPENERLSVSIGQHKSGRFWWEVTNTTNSATIGSGFAQDFMGAVVAVSMAAQDAGWQNLEKKK